MQLCSWVVSLSICTKNTTIIIERIFKEEEFEVLSCVVKNATQLKI